MTSYYDMKPWSPSKICIDLAQPHYIYSLIPRIPREIVEKINENSQ